MPLRLITWNINSVRARMGLVEKLVADYAPDILCLQETKVMDEAFPHKPLGDMGFAHRAIRGQKNHHGVATLARIALEPGAPIDWCAMGDARHISARVSGAGGPVDVHNFYVPAGGDEPDPDANPKFAHKLQFLDEMTAWSAGLPSNHRAILVGDLNVAPLESDVWSHKALLKVVSHTPPETQRMERLMDAHGWVDVMRRFVPEPERLYSWWSYRAKDWRASDRGRRLDHVWVSPALAQAATRMAVLEDVRGWDKPSDHAPVLVEFDL